ncbi:MAG: hypothetical protein AAGG01_10735 [Planctomycetota bacterium]
METATTEAGEPAAPKAGASGAPDRPFMGDVDPTELLDLLVDEAAASLSLLSEFQLDDASESDVIECEVPVWSDIQIVFRIGFSIKGFQRMGLMAIDLPNALVLSGALLMMPTDAVQENRQKDAPDEGDKEAIMEAGNLIAGAFDGALTRRINGSVEIKFFGCQGVAAGDTPWISGYEGQALAVRRHDASFKGFDPFTVTLIIPV